MSGRRRLWVGGRYGRCTHQWTPNGPGCHRAAWMRQHCPPLGVGPVKLSPGLSLSSRLRVVWDFAVSISRYRRCRRRRRRERYKKSDLYGMLILARQSLLALACASAVIATPTRTWDCCWIFWQIIRILTRYQLPHRRMPFSLATSQYGKTPLKTAQKTTQRRMDSHSNYTASRMPL